MTQKKIALYAPVKSAMGANDNPSLLLKTAAGVASGAMAATVANPIEIVKTRMQADAHAGRRGEVWLDLEGSTLNAFAVLAREEGAKGLANGLVPHIARGATVTASQLAVYDSAKRSVMKQTGLEDGLLLRFLASMVAGVVTTTIVAPVDVIKTQVMTSTNASVAGVCRDLLSTYGPLGFFKGWTPSYLRM